MSAGMLLLVLLVVGVVAFALSLLVRRLAPGVSHADTNPASSTMSYVAAAYGVLVGFAIVFLLGQVANARQAIADEATSIGTAFDEAQLFPQGQPQIQHALICYSRSVTEREWPDMADGNSAPETDQAYRELVATYGQVDSPTNSSFQSAAATNSFAQVSAISTARETRLLTATTRFGSLLWIILIGGGLLVLGLIFLLTAKASAPAQAIFVGLAAIFTTVLLSIVMVLDHPYSDARRTLSPSLIEQNTQRMVTLAPDAAALPCSFEQQG